MLLTPINLTSLTFLKTSDREMSIFLPRKFRLLISIIFTFVSIGNNYAASCDDSSKPKVVIIGAGLAGLTVAYRLHQKGYPVTVYEARPRVGGRVHSVLIKNFDGTYSVAELEGQNIRDGGKAHYFLSLARELNLAIIEDDIEFSSLFYDGHSFRDLLTLFKEQGGNSKEIETKLNSYQGSNKSIQEVVDALFDDSSMIKRIISFHIESYEGAPPSKLCTYHNLETLKHILLGSIAAAHQAKEKRPTIHRIMLKGGNALLPLKLAKKLKDRIHLNHVLKKVSLKGDKIKLTFHNGRTILCDKLIIAIPCPVYNDIIFEDSVIPQDKLEKIKKIQYGTHAKILVAIKYKDLSHNSILNDTMSAFFNGDKKLLNIYYRGDSAAHLLCHLNVYFKDALHIIKEGMKGSTLKEGHPIIPKDTQLSFYSHPVVKSWSEDPYAKGSYATYGLNSPLIEEKPYDGILVKSIFEPINKKIYIVGEHATILDEIATMEAAVESAERIATLF